LDPPLLTQLSTKFGAQCVVLAIDAKLTPAGTWTVLTRSGANDTGLDAVEWARKGVQLGAGEILLTSLDRDGTRSGFDCPLLKAVSAAVSVPVVASGGANSAQHMVEAFEAGASAVLAASIFHYANTTVSQVKLHLAANRVPVRPAPEQPSTAPRNNVQCLVPCIDLMDGHAVQLVGGRPEALQIDAGVIVKRNYVVFSILTLLQEIRLQF
jgi:phosphoribosylformimino-5-aminoimidazole carboxamide ribonucleotide (ProFAR) isomerase